VPDVSVVIPTYNRRELLPEAIKSCFDGNDGINVEVIVVDDHSTDGTDQYLNQIKDPRVRALTNPGSNAQTARNAGLEAAQGSTIRFLDDDDYLYPGAIARQFEALTQTDADVVYSDLDEVTQTGDVIRKIEMKPADDMLAGACESQIYGHIAPFLFRLQVAERAPWREEYTHFGDDMAFIFDVAALDPQITYVPGSQAVWRLHDEPSLTDKKSKEAATAVLGRRFRILSDALERRRAETETISEEVRQAIANGMWRYARMIAPYDFGQFLNCYRRIIEMSPSFAPPRSSRGIQLVDDLFSPVVTEAVSFIPRKLKTIVRN
jgi:glycosyltransferase involved in cell wall biosynthesis